MMQFSSLDIQLKGMDTKTDPKRMAPGGTVKIKNASFEKNGAISKRLGLGKVAQGPAALPKINTIFAAGSNIYGSDGVITYIWLSDRKEWAQAHQAQVPVSIEREGVPINLPYQIEDIVNVDWCELVSATGVKYLMICLLGRTIRGGNLTVKLPVHPSLGFPPDTVDPNGDGDNLTTQFILMEKATGVIRHASYVQDVLTLTPVRVVPNGDRSGALVLYNPPSSEPQYKHAKFFDVNFSLEAPRYSGHTITCSTGPIDAAWEPGVRQQYRVVGVHPISGRVTAAIFSPSSGGGIANRVDFPSSSRPPGTTISVCHIGGDGSDVGERFAVAWDSYYTSTGADSSGPVVTWCTYSIAGGWEGKLCAIPIQAGIYAAQVLPGATPVKSWYSSPPKVSKISTFLVKSAPAPGDELVGIAFTVEWPTVSLPGHSGYPTEHHLTANGLLSAGIIQDNGGLDILPINVSGEKFVFEGSLAARPWVEQNEIFPKIMVPIHPKGTSPTNALIIRASAIAADASGLFGLPEERSNFPLFAIVEPSETWQATQFNMGSALFDGESAAFLVPARTGFSKTFSGRILDANKNIGTLFLYTVRRREESPPVAWNGDLSMAALGSACSVIGQQVVHSGPQTEPFMAYLEAASFGSPAFPGSYIYRGSFEWIDANGELHRSALSGPCTHTVVGSAGVVWSGIIFYGDKYGGRRPSMWRTENGGSLFYLAARSSDFDSTGNADLVTREIYNVNELPPIEPDPIAWMAPIGRRIVSVSSTRNVMQCTKIKQSGVCYEWAAELDIPVPSRTHLTSVAGLDGNAIIFARDAIYVAAVASHLDNLGNGNIPECQLIADGVGCDDPPSAVTLPTGVLFKSQDGFRMVDRSLQLARRQDGSFAGSEMDAYADYRCVWGAAIPSRSEARFLLKSEAETVVAVYDYERGEWCVHEYELEVASATVVPDETMRHQIVACASPVAGAMILSEKPGIFYDEGEDAKIFVPLQVETGWINLAGIEGFQLVKKVTISFDQKTPCGVRLRVFIDYDSTTVVADKTWTSEDIGSERRLEMTLPRQKCTAIKFIAEDVEPVNWDPDIDDGEGWVLHGLQLEIGVKRGLSKLPKKVRA